MIQENLREILDKHVKWLNKEDGGKRADFHHADLSGADLHGANLSRAKLVEANLSGADLRYTDMSGVNLCYADLSGGILRGANLLGARLSGTNLTDAVYKDTVLNLQCPEEGSFIAWKKLADDNIAKLLIPEDAERSSATTRKCRASKAIVMAIYNKNGEKISEGRSKHDFGFVYRVGKTVYPDSWDEDRWNECSNGIHFFMTRKEAEEY